MSYTPNDPMVLKIGQVREALQARIQQDPFFLTLLLESISIGAAEYFEECVDDFCLQFWEGERIVFGGTNRLVWSARLGYSPDRSYCTPNFLTHYGVVEARRRA